MRWRFFKSLVKHHGKTYFEPIGKALAAAGIKKPNPLNPSHAWALKGVVFPYLKWMVARRLMSTSSSQIPTMPAELARHAEFACSQLQKMALEVDTTMNKFQLSLADRQCRMAELSGRCQDLITILCTSLYGARQSDEIVRTSADIACQELIQKFTGKRPSNRFYKQVTQLGEAIVEGGFKSIAGLAPDEILMGYEG